MDDLGSLLERVEIGPQQRLFIGFIAGLSAMVALAALYGAIVGHGSREGALAVFVLFGGLAAWFVVDHRRHPTRVRTL